MSVFISQNPSVSLRLISAAGGHRQTRAEILKERETGSEVFNSASIFILFLMRDQVRNGLCV